MYRVVLEEIVPRQGKRTIAVERYRRQVTEEIGPIEFAAAIEDAIAATRKRHEREAARKRQTTPAGSKS